MCVLGQLKDSTHIIGEILIEDSRDKSQTIGIQNIELDSTTFHRNRALNFGDFLALQNILFVKSYGFGALASPSYRGSSAEHTAIIWNGFNMQSPMNGQVDLSLIPPEFIEEAIIQPSSNGAKWGSGSIGGTIHLKNPVKFNEGFKIGASYQSGSFGLDRFSLNMKWSSLKMVLSIKSFLHEAENNFPFQNTSKSGNPIVHQTNNKIEQSGILVENSYLLNKKNILNLKYWFSDSYREIPPLMSNDFSSQYQKDGFHRFFAEWKMTDKKSIWFVRSGFFDERIIYSDKEVKIYTNSRALSNVSEIENSFKLNKAHSFENKFNFTYAEAFSGAYPENTFQQRISLYSSYKLSVLKENLKFNLSARQENINSYTIPLLPYFGADFHLTPSFSFNFNISKSYRVPCFNDLFWIPGGNINLKPESSLAKELGFKWGDKYNLGLNSKLDFSLSGAIFNSNIKDRILWIPQQFGIWSPINIQEVEATGFEIRFRSALDFGKLILEFGGNYDYTKSIVRKSPNANEIGKQLIYTPLNKGSGYFLTSYKGFSLQYSYAFLGYRFTDSDNANFLPNHGLYNLQIAKVLNFKNYNGKFFIQINNIFNETYQVLPNRAMPLRNYLFGVAINFYKPNKSNQL